MQQYYQTSQEELQKAQQTKMQAITAKVTEAIKEVGTAGGYVYVMDVTSGIPFINETLSTDVTAQVKSKLGIK
jgi:outer membrane protein